MTFRELTKSSASPGSFRIGFLRTTPQRSFSRESWSATKLEASIRPRREHEEQVPLQGKLASWEWAVHWHAGELIF